MRPDAIFGLVVVGFLLVFAWFIPPFIGYNPLLRDPPAQPIESGCREAAALRDDPRLCAVMVQTTPNGGVVMIYNTDRPHDDVQPYVMQGGMFVTLEGTYRFRVTWPHPQLPDAFGEVEISPDVRILRFRAEGYEEPPPAVEPET